MAKILVVDDETLIRGLVSDFLKKEGYSTIEAANGNEALALFDLHSDISLIILDVMMPMLDGWQVCKHIRTTSRVPVIMLTARSEEYDELQGFELGVDDYMTKPFSPLVLMARVRALLKRSAAEGEPLCCAGLVINCKKHTVTLAGEVLDLSPKEFELLHYLAANVNHLLSRSQLLDYVWGYDYMGGHRTVDTHIGRLRIKLGAWGDVHLCTVRGFGYKLEV